MSLDIAHIEGIISNGAFVRNLYGPFTGSQEENAKALKKVSDDIHMLIYCGLAMPTTSPESLPPHLRVHVTELMKAYNIKQRARGRGINSHTAITLGRICAAYPETVVKMNQLNDIYQRFHEADRELAKHIPPAIKHPYTASLWIFFEMNPVKVQLIQDYSIEFHRMTRRVFPKVLRGKIDPRRIVEIQMQHLTDDGGRHAASMKEILNNDLLIKMKLAKDSMRLANDLADCLFNYPPYVIGPKLLALMNKCKVNIMVDYDKELFDILECGDEHAASVLNYDNNPKALDSYFDDPVEAKNAKAKHPIMDAFVGYQ